MTKSTIVYLLYEHNFKITHALFYKHHEELSGVSKKCICELLKGVTWGEMRKSPPIIFSI
jgi:hypothetical protein